MKNTQRNPEQYWKNRLRRNNRKAIKWLAFGCIAAIAAVGLMKHLQLNEWTATAACIGMAIALVPQLYYITNGMYLRKRMKRSRANETRQGRYENERSEEEGSLRNHESARIDTNEASENEATNLHRGAVDPHEDEVIRTTEQRVTARAEDEAQDNNIIIDGNVFVRLPKNYIGSYAVPEGITEIADSAFSECKGLIHIALPSTLERIGGLAFYNCTGLMHIELPESCRHVDGTAFRGCTNLRQPICNSHLFAFMPRSYRGSYTLPETIEEISDNAFEQCYDLTAVTLPRSLRIIGSEAFLSCSNLTAVDLPEGIECIYSHAFAETGLTEAIVPSTVVDFGLDVFEACESLKRLEVRSEICDTDGWEYDETIASLFSLHQLEELELPKNMANYVKVCWEEWLIELDELDDFDDGYYEDEDCYDEGLDDDDERQENHEITEELGPDFRENCPTLRKLIIHGADGTKTYEGEGIAEWINPEPDIQDERLY